MHRYCIGLNRYEVSRISGFVGVYSFLEGSVSLDAGIILDGSLSVPDEALVDSLEGGIFLSAGFLDAVLVIFVVLVLG